MLDAITLTTHVLAASGRGGVPRDVIAVKHATLDWNYIHRWTEIHATRAKLDEIRASVPKID